MRRILVEQARRKQAAKRGGDQNRIELSDVAAEEREPVEDVLAIDEALTELLAEDPEKAELVKLRYFAGLSIEEAADAMSISRATACRYWTYAKTWLYCRLEDAKET
jgi:RNA polymerase sigma factor (TIGR02999 family)